MVFRRQTIIALRARHTAFRIASDILYPHQTVRPVPEPVMPIVDVEGDVGWSVRRARRRRRIHAIILTVWLLLMLFVVVQSMIWGTPQPVPQPPPAPQGRSILP